MRNKEYIEKRRYPDDDTVVTTRLESLQATFDGTLIPFVNLKEENEKVWGWVDSLNTRAGAINRVMVFKRNKGDGYNIILTLPNNVAEIVYRTDIDNLDVYHSSRLQRVGERQSYRSAGGSGGGKATDSYWNWILKDIIVCELVSLPTWIKQENRDERATLTTDLSWYN